MQHYIIRAGSLYYHPHGWTGIRADAFRYTPETLFLAHVITAADPDAVIERVDISPEFFDEVLGQGRR